MSGAYQLVRATGASGRVYELQAYPWGTEFQELPGLYIFTTPDAFGGWTPFYVGQTHNFVVAAEKRENLPRRISTTPIV